jgi:hypothetical protein
LIVAKTYVLRETESSLNAANHTVHGLREELREFREELAKRLAEIKNPAAAGGGAGFPHVRPPNSGQAPADLRNPIPVTTTVESIFCRAGRVEGGPMMSQLLDQGSPTPLPMMEIRFCRGRTCRKGGAECGRNVPWLKKVCPLTFITDFYH